jgi:hypothetical protein
MNSATPATVTLNYTTQHCPEEGIGPEHIVELYVDPSLPIGLGEDQARAWFISNAPASLSPAARAFMAEAPLYAPYIVRRALGGSVKHGPDAWLFSVVF